MHEPSEVRLSDEILVLHPGILKVFVFDARIEACVILEEASRAGVGPFASDFDNSLRGGGFNPRVVLEDAANPTLGAPRLVGVAYSDAGIIFARIGERRVLAVCVDVSRFHEVLNVVSEALPRILGEWRVGPASVSQRKSAADAAEIARNYVAAVVKSVDVSVDQVTLEQSIRIWEVQGSYRTFPFARTRRFRLQLSEQNGAVLWFTSIRMPSLAPLLTGISIIFGTLLFLVWWLFLGR